MECKVIIKRSYEISLIIRRIIPLGQSNPAFEKLKRYNNVTIIKIPFIFLYMSIQG